MLYFESITGHCIFCIVGYLSPSRAKLMLEGRQSIIVCSISSTDQVGSKNVLYLFIDPVSSFNINPYHKTDNLEYSMYTSRMTFISQTTENILQHNNQSYYTLADLKPHCSMTAKCDGLNFAREYNT